MRSSSLRLRSATRSLNSAIRPTLQSIQTPLSSLYLPSSTLPLGLIPSRRLLSGSSLTRASISATIPRLQPRQSDKGGPRTPLEGEEAESASEEVEKSEAESNEIVKEDGVAAEGKSCSIAASSDKSSSSSPPRSASASASSSAPSSTDGNNTTAPPASSDGSDGPNSTSVSKRSVPEIYPQVLALPITRRPLFPGFYKAVVIRNPAVVAAIKEMMKRGQPYIGAFLLKDENADSDM